MDAEASEQTKLSAAQLRQRKELLVKITKRNQQLIGAKDLLVSRSKIHELNSDLGKILSHQDKASDLFDQIRGAREHFNTFLWETQFIADYGKMLEIFVNDTKDKAMMKAAQLGHKKTTPNRAPKNASTKSKTPGNKFVLTNKTTTPTNDTEPQYCGNKTKRVQVDTKMSYDEMNKKKIDRVLKEFMDLLTTQDAMMPKLLRALYDKVITLDQVGYAQQRRLDDMYAIMDDTAQLGTTHICKKVKTTPSNTESDKTPNLIEDNGITVNNNNENATIVNDKGETGDKA